MGLTPEEIERREFTSTLRGFDRIEVREFLHRVAELVRDLEEARDAAVQRVATVGTDSPELESARRAADEVRAAAAEEAARLLRESEAYGHQARVEADRLRADADRIRRQAIHVVEQRRAQVDALVERRRGELDELAEQRRRQLADLVRSEQARVQSAGRAVEVARQEAEAARREADAARRVAQEDQARAHAELERAQAELQEARHQVAHLLEQARAQSELIRAEADELVRVKVRTTTAQAEERLGVLRTTEQASRERIRAAQRELDAALHRLDANAPPALAAGTDEAVLEEVRVRVLGGTTTAQVPPTLDLSVPVPSDGPVPVPAGDVAASAARQFRASNRHPSIPAALVGGAPPEVGRWPAPPAPVCAPADTHPSAPAPLPSRTRPQPPPIPAPSPAGGTFPTGPVRHGAVPPVPPAPASAVAAGATAQAMARMVKDAMQHASDGGDRPPVSH